MRGILPHGAAAFWPALAWVATAMRRQATAQTSAAAGESRYLIGSFPHLRQVNYARLPDVTWRALVPTEGLVGPEAICVDHENKRLFVADPSVGMVYWYQLQFFDDERLITDGRQRLAAHSTAARGLATDSTGNLYVAGTRLGLSSSDGVFRQDAGSFAMDVPPPPVPVWTRQNANLQIPNLAMPFGIAVDPFHVYWGNKIREENGSSVVQATAEVPALRQLQGSTAAESKRLQQEALQASVRPLANNVQSVTSLAFTPGGILYATKGGVYGVPLSKAWKGCGVGGAVCPMVVAADDPTGLVWDGDGTVYLADRTRGGVYSFPSGTVTEHSSERVAGARGIFGVAVLTGRSP